MLAFHRPLCLLCLLALQTGCSAYHSTSRYSVLPGSDVRVRFASPAPVIVEYDEPDSVRHFEIPQARAVEGKVTAMARDTIRLSPVWTLQAPQIRSDHAFPAAAVVVSESTAIAVRRFSPERTTLLILVLGAAVYAVAATYGPSLSLTLN